MQSGGDDAGETEAPSVEEGRGLGDEGVGEVGDFLRRSCRSSLFFIFFSSNGVFEF